MPRRLKGADGAAAGPPPGKKKPIIYSQGGDSDFRYAAGEELSGCTTLLYPLGLSVK